MKKLLLAAVVLFPSISLAALVKSGKVTGKFQTGGDVAGNGDEAPLPCNLKLATLMGRTFSDYMLKADGFDTSAIRTVITYNKQIEDEFSIATGYDFGLTVPAYTVTFSSTDCSILNVEKSNWEG